MAVSRVFVASALSLAVIFGFFATSRASDWPEGYGKARFGMSIEEFKNVYPEARRMGGEPTQEELAELDEHGHPKANQGLVVYTLEGQSLDELSPCTVKFRFAWNKLYQIGFDCGRDPKVVDYLEKRFGKTRTRQGVAEYWYGDRVVVSLNPTSYAFGFVDRELGTAVTNQLLAEILRGGVGAPTPSPAPESESP